jgi:hypothetical protein
MKINIPVWFLKSLPYIFSGLISVLAVAASWTYAKGIKDTKKEEHNIYIEQVLKDNAIKLDTVINRQNWVIANIKDLKLHNKKLDIKDSIIKSKLESHELKEAKTRDEIINTLNSFREWNTYISPDTTKKNFICNRIKEP